MEGKQHVFVINRTKVKIPKLPYERALRAVFTRSPMEVSLVFVGDARMKGLNSKYRQKEKTTDVLAFALEAGLGEIFISSREAMRRAQEEGKTFSRKLLELVVHGMLHLKGYDHVLPRERSKMERLERKIFQILTK